MTTETGKHIDLDLGTLLTSEQNDSLSGQTYGRQYADKIHLLNEIEKGNKIVLTIPKEIYAINGSFWKGFFSPAFEKYKTKEKVKSFFEFKTENNFFKRSIDNNLTILEAIFNV